ncbi:PAS domain S-box protein [Methanospirillum hungatei]|nr:PAS domain S-box protein [Methanospirillum hungatei]
MEKDEPDLQTRSCMISHLRNIRIPDKLPLILLIVTSVSAIIISIISLQSGWTTIFQNLYYFPIIIACAFYFLRGFLFSVMLIVFYITLIFLYTRDPSILAGEGIRAVIFTLVAGTVTYLSVQKEKATTDLAERNIELQSAYEQIQSSEEELKQQLEEIYTAQQEIDDREHTYRQLFTYNSAGIALHEIICDTDGNPVNYRFIEVNPAFTELTGLREEEIIGKTVLEVLPGTEQYWIDLYGRVALTGQSAHIENYSRELDKYFEVTAYSPRKGQFATLIQDITERSRHEALLKETNAYLENLINNANVPILVWDKNLLITRANHSFELLSGWNADDLKGKTLEILFPPENAAESMRLIRTTHDGVRWDTVRLAIQHRNGEIKTIVWNSSTIYDPDGQVIATIAQGRDITQEIHLEEEKEKLTTQIQENIAKLAILNDGIRNPLTIITSLIDMRDMIDSGELERQIREQVSRIDDMIQSLDQEWVNSVKILDYLRKHHHIHKYARNGERIKQKGSSLKHEDPQGQFVPDSKTLLIEEVQAQLYTILDSIDAIIYVADMETYELLYINKKARAVFGDDTGRKCYQWLNEGRNAPCEFCTNMRLVVNAEPAGVYRWECHNPSNNRWYDCRDRAIRWTDGRLVRLEIATDVTDEKCIDDTRNYLLHSDYLQFGEDFFQSVVRYLKEILAASYVSIDILTGNNEAQTLASCPGFDDRESGSFPIHHTIFPHVIGKKICSYDHNVHLAFQDDPLLLNLQANCYVGTTIWSYSGIPIGVISVIWKKEPETLHLAEPLLKMVSVRASGEIERLQAEKRLKENETRIREKLSSLLEPEGDISSLDLAQIIDTDELQLLMNDFYAVSGIGVAIIDLKGNVLVATGWQDICVQYHRIHPETCKNCIESDTILSQGVYPGTFRLYRCKNNMWDIATPITIGNTHIGNLFLGQFFFDDEEIDKELFRKQAQTYGFDEDAYIRALEKVPRWSHQTVDHVMHFYTRLIHLISQECWSTITLARTVNERDTLLEEAWEKDEELHHQLEELRVAHTDLIKTEEALKENLQKLRDLIETSPDIIWEIDAKGNFTYISRQVFDLLGYTPDELLNSSILKLVQKESHEMVLAELAQHLQLPGKVHSLIVSAQHKDGTERIMEIRANPVVNDDGIVIGMRGITHDVTELKSAEQELLRSEEKYRHIFEDATIGIFQTTPSGQIIMINDAMARMFGYENQAEVFRLNRRVDQDLYSISKDRKALLEDLKSGQPVFLREIEFKKKDGTIFTGSVNVRTISDEKGNPILYEGTIIDITEHKQIEKAIAQSEERFHKILDLVPDMISIHDPEMNIIYSNWNGFGSVPPECRITGSKCYTTYRGLDTICPDCLAGNALKTKQAIETEVKLPEGIWIDLRVIPLLNDEGEVILFMECVRDITEKKLADEELWEERQRLASIIAGTRAGTWEWNVQTGDVTINSIWAEMLGYSRDELMPVNIHTWENLTHPEDLPIVMDILEKHFNKENSHYDAEFRMRHKNGNWVYIHDRGQVMSWTDDGSPLMMYGTHTDITEKKEAEKALFEANKKLNLLSDITRHDIRNSLTSLLIFLDKTRLTPISEETKEDIDRIEKIALIIQKAIEFTHEYQNIGVKQAVWHDIAAMVQSVSEQLQKEPVRFRIDLNGLEVFADPLMERAILNIIENAFRYGGPDLSEIRIYYEDECQDDHLSWIIEDNGAGIRDDEKPHLFEHGYGKNTGFGLFFTREILAITGITIEENGSYGHGARFEIRIPRGKWRMES